MTRGQIGSSKPILNAKSHFMHCGALGLQCTAWLLQCCFSSWTLQIHNSGYTRTNRNRILISSYVFPATPGRVGDDIQKGIGQVALIIKRIVPPTESDVTEIPARQKEQNRESVLRWKRLQKNKCKRLLGHVKVEISHRTLHKHSN